MTRKEVLSVAKPILFNTDMGRAIQDGTKTVIRRLIKHPYYIDDEDVCRKSGLAMHVGTNATDGMPYPDNPYKVGDILYVRETWREEHSNYECCIDTSSFASNPVCFMSVVKTEYYYLADCKDNKGDIRWRPSIHMPKEAARIFLRVTGVRVERLQNMTEEDAFMEGFSGVPWCAHSVFESYPDSPIPCEAAAYPGCPPDPPCNHSIPELFGADIWDKTIKKSDLAKYGWEANPWVFVIEFERVEVAE